MNDRAAFKDFVLDLRDIDVLGRSEGGRGCTICDLEDKTRHKLHLDLLSGVSYRDVARRFSVTRSSVHRHLINHLWPEVTRILGAHADLVGADLMDAETVIHDLGRVRAAMAGITFDDTEETKDRIGASRSVAGISRTALELSGHLSRGNNQTVQIVNSTAVETEIAPVLDRIMAALTNHPEAALAVANALSLAPPIEDAVFEALPTAE